MSTPLNSEEDCKIIYTQKVLSGNKTYIFDVRRTSNNEILLVINLSRRIASAGDNGQRSFSKQRIIISQRDFQKFSAGINQILDYIQQEF